MQPESSPKDSDQPESSGFLWAEMLSLFGAVPLLLAVPLPFPLKLAIVAAALTYAALLSVKIGLFRQVSIKRLAPPKVIQSSDLLKILGRFGLFVSLSTLYVYWFSPLTLFQVVLSNPLFWLAISLFYSLVSVYPQEFIYRVLFFARYRQLIPSQIGFVALNAAVFCLAHLFLLNLQVLILTLAGGILFALTYQKSRSFMLVSLEHSAYGVWLFTVGLGEQFAFPVA